MKKSKLEKMLNASSRVQGLREIPCLKVVGEIIPSYYYNEKGKTYAVISCLNKNHYSGEEFIYSIKNMEMKLEHTISSKVPYVDYKVVYVPEGCMFIASNLHDKSNNLLDFDTIFINWYGTIYAFPSDEFEETLKFLGIDEPLSGMKDNVYCKEFWKKH